MITLEGEIASVEEEISVLEATSAEQLWLNDLDEFMAAWTPYTEWRQEVNVPAESSGPKPKKKVVKRKA